MKYAWIAKHRAQWPITLACEVLGASASGYFEHWRRKDADKPGRPGANKRISDEALLVHIKAIHAEVKQEYGWPKMWKELVARGIRVGKERVRKLMQRHGIKARGKRKFVVTTDLTAPAGVLSPARHLLEAFWNQGLGTRYKTARTA